MSFPPGTEMFQFPGFALKTLCVQVPSTCPTRLETARQSTVGCQVGCPIRRSTDQGLFSAPHGLSQSTTSFIASCRLGIHQTPLLRLIRSRRRRTVRNPRATAPFCIGPPRPGSSPPPGSSATGAPPRQTGRPASVSVILTWERRPSASARIRRHSGAGPPDGDASEPEGLFRFSLSTMSKPRVPCGTRKGPNESLSRSTGRRWWVWEDSNLRPYAYQAYALTT